MKRHARIVIAFAAAVAIAVLLRAGSSVRGIPDDPSVNGAEP